jgi:hypothetical protein
VWSNPCQGIVQPMCVCVWSNLCQGIVHYLYRKYSKNSKEFKSNKLMYILIVLGLVFFCSSSLPEDGTLVPKHVGVWYLLWIVFYKLYFIVFYWVHLLVDTVTVRICKACVTQNIFLNLIFILSTTKNLIVILGNGYNSL